VLRKAMENKLNRVFNLFTKRSLANDPFLISLSVTFYYEATGCLDREILVSIKF
jgi:hypothetical protein